MYIQVIEDDAGVRDALLTLLSGYGHDVLCFPDAETYLSEGKAAEADLVFVDLDLPGMAGDALIRLSAQETKGFERFVAISGLAYSQLKRALTGLDNIRYLRKPLKPTEIVPLLSRD